MAPSVIVVGASGNLGPAIVQALLAHKSDFDRIAILAAPEKKEKFAKDEAHGMEIVIGSFTDQNSFKGFDVILSLTGNQIMGQQPEMIDAAIAAGARHFIPSEYGVDISQTAFLKERYFVDKHRTRDHLRVKAKEIPGFSYTFVMIGAFAETLALSTVFGVDRDAKTFTFYGNPETEYSLTTMAETARHTVESILMPLDQGQTERELRVANGNWKMKDVIQILGKVQGIEYTSKYLPISDSRELQAKYHQNGETDMELLMSLRALFGSPYCVVPKPWDNDKFSFTPLTLEQMFKSFQG